MCREPAQRCHRGHVYDRSAAGFDEFGYAVAAAMEGAEEIERDGVLPYGHVDFGNGRVLNDRSAGAIVEHVEFAKAADGLLNRTLDAILARDVGLDEESVAAGVTNRCFDGSS